jgi:hypothetical protein
MNHASFVAATAAQFLGATFEIRLYGDAKSTMMKPFWPECGTLHMGFGVGLGWVLDR